MAACVDSYKKYSVFRQSRKFPCRFVGRALAASRRKILVFLTAVLNRGASLPPYQSHPEAAGSAKTTTRDASRSA